jgi:hypothetical protein
MSARPDARFITATQADGSIGVRRSLRPSLLLGTAMMLVVPLTLMNPSNYAAGDPELQILLRGIAGIKGVLALLALAAVGWRLGQPGLTVSRSAVYIGGVWAMVLATGLVWQLSHFLVASLLFHGATITLLATAWSDLDRRSTRHLREDHGQGPAEGDGDRHGADQRVAGLLVHPTADQSVDHEVRHDHDGNDQQEEEFFEGQRHRQAQG